MYNHGLYKISDWGLSKLMIDESVTLSGATPQYAAPEQISHEYGKPDERTDIYQLGTVFYELVTGKLPFEGEMAELYGSILTTIPTIPSEINDQALDVENIIMKCLSKNKEDRFKSMEEFLKELEEFYKPSTGIRDETILYDDEIPLN
jgi:serine/threonine protein kinase